MVDDSGQAGALEDQQIEVTPAMVEAGISEMQELQFGTSLREIVYDVYLAMEGTRRAGKSRPRQ